MTERLYHLDSYVTDFEAMVLEVTTLDRRPAIVLDRTHFYPTSGGQAFDVGKLDSLSVIDVVAIDDIIYHITDRAPQAAFVGSIISGSIEWQRRYDHMQQHSGQHLLSQTFFDLFGYETVSVHFGVTESTLDLDTVPLTDKELADAERFANAQIYANRPIKSYFVDDIEVKQIPLRRMPKVSGQIRIVEIDRFDYSACGGTHCRRTGELGPVKLLKQTRQNRKARISFVCGWRGLTHYAKYQRLLQATAESFDTEVGQVPKLVVSAQEQIKEAQLQIDRLSGALVTYESADLAAKAQDIGAYSVIEQIFTERDIPAAKRLANHLIQEPGRVILFGIVDGEKLTVIFARSDDVDKHMGTLLRQTLQEFGGGGGGRSELAQGGGASASSAEAALAYAKDQLTQ